jgi:hypothetical protein
VSGREQQVSVTDQRVELGLADHSRLCARLPHEDLPNGEMLQVAQREADIHDGPGAVGGPAAQREGPFRRHRLGWPLRGNARCGCCPNGQVSAWVTVESLNSHLPIEWLILDLASLDLHS